MARIIVALVADFLMLVALGVRSHTLLAAENLSWGNS